MYENDKWELIEAAWELNRIGLVRLNDGCVSVRKESCILVTPGNICFDQMEAEDVLVLDVGGQVVEGAGSIYKDWDALRYIYSNMPEVGAVIHTHQPCATAVGLTGDSFPACCTTLCNVCLGSVQVAPNNGEDMGALALKYLGDRRAVILREHGVITVGPGLHEALAASVYMEDAAKCYLAARGAAHGSEVALMTPEQEAEAVETFRDYGQKRG